MIYGRAKQLLLLRPFELFLLFVTRSQSFYIGNNNLNRFHHHHNLYIHRPALLHSIASSHPSFSKRCKSKSAHQYYFCCTPSSADDNTITPIHKNNIITMTTLYTTISKSLMTDVVDATGEPTSERAMDLLAALSNEKQPITIEILESTKIGKILVKVVKACKRHKRTSSADDQQQQWSDAISTAEQLLAKYKAAADTEAKANSKKQAKSTATAAASSQKPGLPTSTSVYKSRLVSQKKEMYKDPPALPPAHIEIESKLVPALPKRNKNNGELTFIAGKDKSIAKALKEDFHPNRTPEEVLRAGSFGGTYFRPISSAVTNIRYYNPNAVLKDTVQPSWIVGLNKSTTLTSTKYNTSINKYKVKCGGSLGMWESSGWISDSDPYGWFQWYCRFYSGRRCSDDARQISRWCKSAGLRGRFRSQICNKILAAGTSSGDDKISPVIRQTLLHWGLEITEDIVEKHSSR